MVIAFEESCRTQIEQEYGSIIEFKRDVHKALSMFNQEQLQMALYAIYEALRKCAEVIIEAIRQLAESLTEAIQPIFHSIGEVSREVYENNWFIPLNEDLYIAHIPKHVPVMKLDKVPVNYSMNVRAQQIPHRCRSNC